MFEFAVKVLLGYLLGSVVGSLLIGRFRGIDIRTQGSGNAGGTNALRTQGKAFAAGVVLIDVAKGWLAARAIPAMSLPLGGPGLGGADGVASGTWLALACGLAAVVGHVYPLWHGFRGGKGGATLIGVLIATCLPLLAVALGVWLIMVILFGYVGLATVTAAGAMPFAVLALDIAPRAPWLAFAAAVAAFVAFTHRSNLARVRAKTEPRARRLWLFGRARP